LDGFSRIFGLFFCPAHLQNLQMIAICVGRDALGAPFLLRTNERHNRTTGQGQWREGQRRAGGVAPYIGLCEAFHHEFHVIACIS